jgi:hypothetical protein
LWATAYKQEQKMQANNLQFRLPCGCGGTMRVTSPDGAHPGLHLKPAIGPVLCCIAPAAAMVDEFERNTQNTNKKQLLASNYGTF